MVVATCCPRGTVHTSPTFFLLREAHVEALPQQLRISGVHVAKTAAGTSYFLSPAFLLFVHGHRAEDEALNSLAANEIHYHSHKIFGGGFVCLYSCTKNATKWNFSAN